MIFICGYLIEKKIEGVFFTHLNKSLFQKGFLLSKNNNNNYYKVFFNKKKN